MRALSIAAATAATDLCCARSIGPFFGTLGVSDGSCLAFAPLRSPFAAFAPLAPMALLASTGFAIAAFPNAGLIVNAFVFEVFAAGAAGAGDDFAGAAADFAAAGDIFAAAADTFAAAGFATTPFAEEVFAASAGLVAVGFLASTFFPADFFVSGFPDADLVDVGFAGAGFVAELLLEAAAAGRLVPDFAMRLEGDLLAGLLADLLAGLLAGLLAAAGAGLADAFVAAAFATGFATVFATGADADLALRAGAAPPFDCAFFVAKKCLSLPEARGTTVVRTHCRGRQSNRLAAMRQSDPDF